MTKSEQLFIVELVAMKFFKPTRWKILLTIIIGILWYFGMGYVGSFFGCGGVGEGLPLLPGQAIPPTPFYEPFMQIIIGAFGFLFALPLWCGGSPQEFYLSEGLADFLIIIISFIISCSIILFIAKKRKRVEILKENTT